MAAKKDGSPLLFIGLAALVFLYWQQTGAPEGTGGFFDMILPDSPGDAADKVADGAKTGADKAANDATPWIARNGPVLGAGVVAFIVIWFWRKYKVLAVVGLTALIVGALVMLAT